MKLSEFKNHLRDFPNHELRFVLPDGGLIEAHAHVTEVGRVEKSFIDCGGTIRRTANCALQVWVADDLEHRLAPGTLAGVIDLAKPVLGDEDLDVEIEYQDGLISQFPVVSSAISPEGALQFHLTTKSTDCLAKERCGVSDATAGDEEATEGSCCAGTGCC